MWNDRDVSGENPPSTSSFGPKSGTIPPDPYDDRSGELMDVLAMLYFLVEVFRSDETFGDELSMCSSLQHFGIHALGFQSQTLMLMVLSGHVSPSSPRVVFDGCRA